MVSLMDIGQFFTEIIFIISIVIFIKLTILIIIPFLKFIYDFKVLMIKNFDEIKLYILSLMFLFIIIFIMSINTLPCINAVPCKEYQLADYLMANWLPILMFFAVIICEIIRRNFEFKMKGGGADSLVVGNCQSESYEHLTFLSTYIIPFLGFNFESTFRLLAYLFLLVLIGVILIRTGGYYANPTLAIFGYKLYRVDLSDKNECYKSLIVITKNNLKTGDNVNYSFISDTVCFVRKTD